MIPFWRREESCKIVPAWLQESLELPASVPGVAASTPTLPALEPALPALEADAMRPPAQQPGELEHLTAPLDHGLWRQETGRRNDMHLPRGRTVSIAEEVIQVALTPLGDILRSEQGQACHLSSFRIRKLYCIDYRIDTM